MKSTLKLIVAAGICSAIVYSCKTAVVAPTSTSSTQTVASEIAASLSKSFQGQLGGQNINNGLKSTYATSRKGPAINGIYDLCGTGTDTTFNQTTLAHEIMIGRPAGVHFTYD